MNAKIAIIKGGIPMEIIVTIIGTVTTVITVCLTNYFTKKNQLRFDERKLKEEYYMKFIEALSDNVNLSDKEAAKNSLAYAWNRLILVSSVDVIQKLLKFEDEVDRIITNKGGTEEAHNSALTELIKAIRVDLFGAKKINIDYPRISIHGRTPYTDSKVK
jgi:hypothetical protein